MMSENQTLDEKDELLEIYEKMDKNLTLEPSSPPQSDDEEEEDDENEEFEFSFFGGDLKSPVSAEEVFEDGQIRIISPFPGEDSGEGESSSSSYAPSVKNLFVVSNSSENDDVAEGQYCLWKSPTPEMSQKSNSTGFSKLWKMRDLLARSNSDGKDAFVFLNGKGDDATTAAKAKRKEEKKNKMKLEKLDVVERKVVDTAAHGGERKEGRNKKKKSAYEVLYGGGKDKKKGGGKSYLPYRQDLVGFFTNGSALSRNVHPY
ncbi:hypothetical protein SOVF_023750 [Spinacia oleracea]|uniref:Uncharacterized protein n=1 Tax=Spinacia oleracea TaxID=3562 RepID=A0A9R0I523_SPIOL|nr:uncharacterized protein LOC110782818 [Spinacia oleracea]KNA23569.1 hypothetical protein SOVF_023750 [Spinacia oleracea]